MKTVTFAAPFNPLRWFDKGTYFFHKGKNFFILQEIIRCYRHELPAFFKISSTKLSGTTA